MTFFVEEREHLFSPLAGKYRELLLACLKSLYLRMFGAQADRAPYLLRDDIKDIIALVVQTVPLPAPSADDDDDETRHVFRGDEKARCAWVIRELTNSGWLETSIDKGTMQSVYRFSRIGRALTEALVRLDRRGLKSRQRNVRNTRYLLEGYARDMNPYDLLDAVDHAQLIVQDLADDIDDLYERRRELMRVAVEQASLAVDQFLDFIRNHFQPELSVKLAADSVERHSIFIDRAIREILNWSPERMAKAQASLDATLPEDERSSGRFTVPHLVRELQGHLDVACSGKLPELRSALSSFINRTGIVMRQATATAYAEMGGLSRSLKRMAALPLAEQDRLLGALAPMLTPLEPQLVDPGEVRLRKRASPRSIDEVSAEPIPTREERLEAALLAARETAFQVNIGDIHARLVQEMGDDDVLYTSQLAVTDAPSLLTALHAIEVAQVGLDDVPVRLRIEPVVGERTSDTYTESDVFKIRKDFS